MKPLRSGQVSEVTVYNIKGIWSSFNKPGPWVLTVNSPTHLTSPRYANYTRMRCHHVNAHAVIDMPYVTLRMRAKYIRVGT